MRIIRIRDTHAIALCLIFVFLAIGCTTTKRMTEDMVGDGGRLKKKIAFLPTLNKTGYGGKEFADSARTHLNTSLKRFCNDLVIIDSPKIDSLLKKMPRLPSGQVDHLALAKFGRVFGLNALLEESLAEIECVTDKRGIWGFRSVCMLVQLSVGVRAFDIETGAILFDEVVSDKVEVSEHDWQVIKERSGYPNEVIDRLVIKTTSKICKTICEVIGNEPWKGYITSESDNTFALTAGKDVGLSKGDVLEVFEMREPIKGYIGQFYLVSGSKIGELRIIRVHTDRAETIAILGRNLQKSSYVRLKQ